MKNFLSFFLFVKERRNKRSKRERNGGRSRGTFAKVVRANFYHCSSTKNDGLLLR